MNETRRKQLPSHVVGYAHHGHHQQYRQYNPDMKGHGKDKGWNNESAGDGFPRMEAHGSPGRRRPAGMVHRVYRGEQGRVMHRSVRPVEPGVVDRQAKKKGHGQPPHGIGADVFVDLRPAEFLPTPCNQSCRRSIHHRAKQRPRDFPADLQLQAAIKARVSPFAKPCEGSAGHKVTDSDDCDHR